MNLDIYRYMMAVANTRNITKAAESLHISQPALTKAIRRQEEALGVKLFEREGTPLTLTYAGERYLKQVQKLLAIEQELREEMESISRGTKERVRLGITLERGTVWLPRILPAFAISHPEVEVQVQEGYNVDFERQLLNDELDFCISSTPPITSQEIDCEVTDGAPVYIISSRDHPLAQLANLDTNSFLKPQYIAPARLEGQRFLSLTPGQGMHSIMQQLFEKYALHVNIIHQLTSQRTITLLAAAGLGLALTTFHGAMQATAEQDLHPVFYTIEDPMYQRRSAILYKRGHIFSPAAMALIDLSRQVMLNSDVPHIEIRH